MPRRLVPIDPVPLDRLQVEQGPEAPDPGVQDGDGQAAEGVMGPTDAVDHGRLVGDVAD